MVIEAIYALVAQAAVLRCLVHVLLAYMTKYKVIEGGNGIVAVFSGGRTRVVVFRVSVRGDVRVPSEHSASAAYTTPRVHAMA